MTPKQMIQHANSVRVMVELAGGGCPHIYISKKEARRIVDDYGLPHDETGTVHLNDVGVCSIILVT